MSCPGCVVCEGQSHHWRSAVETVSGLPVFECVHCDAIEEVLDEAVCITGGYRRSFDLVVAIDPGRPGGDFSAAAVVVRRPDGTRQVVDGWRCCIWCSAPIDDDATMLCSSITCQALDRAWLKRHPPPTVIVADPKYL